MLALEPWSRPIAPQIVEWAKIAAKGGNPFPDPIPKPDPKPKSSSAKYVMASIGVVIALVIMVVMFGGKGREGNNAGGRTTEERVREVTGERFECPSDGIYFTYTGRIENELPNGQGKAIYDNGSSYEGGFKDGYRHGRGKRIYTQGGKRLSYEGPYVEGEAHGERGVLINFTDDERFEVSWRNDNM